LGCDGDKFPGQPGAAGLPVPVGQPGRCWRSDAALAHSDVLFFLLMVTFWCPNSAQFAPCRDTETHQLHSARASKAHDEMDVGHCIRSHY
jgi:hypothetical protein